MLLGPTGLAVGLLLFIYALTQEVFVLGKTHRRDRDRHVTERAERDEAIKLLLGNDALVKRMLDWLEDERPKRAR